MAKKNIKLKDISLFAELGDEALKKFSSIMEEHSFSEGQKIFAEGDPGDALFVVLKGKVEIRKAIDTVSIREKVLATMKEGDFFGDMSLYSGEPRSASAYAVEGQVLVKKIPSDKYLSLMQTDLAIASKLSYAIIKILSNRLRSTSKELVVLFETGKIAGSITDPDKLCSTIVERLCELMQAEAGLLVLNNDLSANLEIKASHGMKKGRTKGISLAQPPNIIKKVFEGELPLIADGFEDGCELNLMYDGEGEIKTLLCVPLAPFQGAPVIGALLIGDTTENAYSDSEKNLLMGVSRQIASSLENARLNFELKARKDYKRIYIQPSF